MAIANLPHTSKADTDANLFADVVDNCNAILAQLNGNIEAANLASNAVTTTKIADANVTDAKLASPNNSVYRTIASGHQIFGQDLAAGTYLFRVGADGVIVSGSPIAASTSPATVFRFTASDYAVAAKTLKWRLRAQAATNATAPGVILSVRVCPVTVAGGADQLTYTAGASAVNVELTTPPASTVTSGESVDFGVPSDGSYCFVVTTVATLANNSLSSIHAQLQVRNV